MASLTDYFNAKAYQSTYEIGDRIFGKFNDVPFVGTVGNDRVVSLAGPEVVVHLDLPMKLDKGYTTVIIVKHKDIKSRLKSMDDEEPLKLPVAGSIPVKRTKTKGK